MSVDQLKSILRRTGLYAPVRSIHRRISAAKRKERSETRRFYETLVGRGVLCFDIGANVGQTTEALVACGAKVIAVEPNPLCSPVLEWQFGRHPDVVLVKKAVGSVPGRTVLHFSGTDSTASVREDWPFANRESASVDVTTLDELISEYGRPKLCKVDVEGFEVEVFKGLHQPLPIIYFEMHRDELDRACQVVTMLAKLGPIIEVNLTPVNHHISPFEKWVSVDAFMELSKAKVDRMANVVLKMVT